MSSGSETTPPCASGILWKVNDPPGETTGCRFNVIRDFDGDVCSLRWTCLDFDSKGLLDCVDSDVVESKETAAWDVNDPDWTPAREMGSLTLPGYGDAGVYVCQVAYDVQGLSVGSGSCELLTCEDPTAGTTDDGRSYKRRRTLEFDSLGHLWRVYEETIWEDKGGCQRRERDLIWEMSPQKGAGELDTGNFDLEVVRLCQHSDRADQYPCPGDEIDVASSGSCRVPPGPPGAPYWLQKLILTFDSLGILQQVEAETPIECECHSLECCHYYEQLLMTLYAVDDAGDPSTCCRGESFILYRTWWDIQAEMGPCFLQVQWEGLGSFYCCEPGSGDSGEGSVPGGSTAPLSCGSGGNMGERYWVICQIDCQGGDWTIDLYFYDLLPTGPSWSSWSPGMPIPQDYTKKCTFAWGAVTCCDPLYETSLTGGETTCTLDPEPTCHVHVHFILTAPAEESESPPVASGSEGSTG